MLWNVFQDSITTNFRFFTKPFLVLIFFGFIVIIQVFQTNRKSPLGFDYKLPENVFWPYISCQLLL